MNHYIQTDYLEDLYDNESFLKKINSAARKIKKFRTQHPFEAIAFSGMSGAGFAYPLSYKLKIPLICVRKAQDSAHCRLTIEGAVKTSTYLIVDDFIESGKTIQYILKSMKARRCVGIYFYRSCHDIYVDRMSRIDPKIIVI